MNLNGREKRRYGRIRKTSWTEHHSNQTQTQLFEYLIKISIQTFKIFT